MNESTFLMLQKSAFSFSNISPPFLPILILNLQAGVSKCGNDNIIMTRCIAR